MKTGADARAARRILTLALATTVSASSGCALVAPWLPGEAGAELRAEQQWQDVLEQQRARRGAHEAAPERDDRPAAAHLREGDQHLERGDLSKASVSYLRAHYRDPDARAPLARIGFVGLARDPKRSERYFREILDGSPDDPDATLGLGASLLAQGVLDEAIGVLERARDQGERARVHSVLGVAYDRAGRPEQAQTAYRAALALAPNDASVQNNLGISLLLTERYEEAVAAFEAGRRRDPDHGALANNLGIALTFLGRYEDALASFASVATRGDALNNLGYALMLKGELSAARRFFEEALLSNETDELRVLQNLVLLEGIEHSAQTAAEVPESPAPPASVDLPVPVPASAN